jgi:hypothetical protein
MHSLASSSINVTKKQDIYDGEKRKSSRNNAADKKMSVIVFLFYCFVWSIIRVLTYFFIKNTLYWCSKIKIIK